MERKFQRALCPSPTVQYAAQADVVPFLSGNIATGPHLLLLKDAKEPFEHYLVYCKGTAPFLITTALPADAFFFSWNREDILCSLSSNPFFHSQFA